MYASAPPAGQLRLIFCRQHSLFCLLVHLSHKMQCTAKLSLQAEVMKKGRSNFAKDWFPVHDNTDGRSVVGSVLHAWSHSSSASSPVVRVIGHLG